MGHQLFGQVRRANGGTGGDVDTGDTDQPVALKIDGSI
jgi:hypothetical protein